MISPLLQIPLYPALLSTHALVSRHGCARGGIISNGNSRDVPTEADDAGNEALVTVNGVWCRIGETIEATLLPIFGIAGVGIIEGNTVGPKGEARSVITDGNAVIPFPAEEVA